MNRLLKACAIGFAGIALTSAAAAQNRPQDPPPIEISGETSRIAVIEGKVVRYEPGKTIVVIDSGKEVTYSLSPSVVVPADVRVGKTVSLSTEPSEGGQVVVTKITTTSVTPEGDIKTETETRKTQTSEMSSGGDVRITGRVTAIQPGQSVTFVLPDNQTVVYTLDSSSVVPSDLAIGKTYVVETTRTDGSGPMVVKKIVTTTTKKTTRIQ